MSSDSGTDIGFIVIVVLCVLGFDYLRNGPPRWLGFDNGGIYWVNRTYYDKHPTSRMSLDGEEVSCSRVLEMRSYCRKNPDDSVQFMKHSIGCDDWMDRNFESETPES